MRDIFWRIICYPRQALTDTHNTLSLIFQWLLLIHPDLNISDYMKFYIFYLALNKNLREGFSSY